MTRFKLNISVFRLWRRFWVKWGHEIKLKDFKWTSLIFRTNSWLGRVKLSFTICESILNAAWGNQTCSVRTWHHIWAAWFWSDTLKREVFKSSTTWRTAGVTQSPTRAPPGTRPTSENEVCPRLSTGRLWRFNHSWRTDRWWRAASFKRHGDLQSDPGEAVRVSLNEGVYVAQRGTDWWRSYF